MAEADVSTSVVTAECLGELIEFFANRTTPYRARHEDKRYEVVEKMCLHLLARDYHVQTVNNSNGQLCPHYPAQLVILEGHAEDTKNSTTINNANKLQDLFKASKMARSLCRFPVPVILLNNKNICRSSTLATPMELYGRSGWDWIFSGRDKDTADINGDLQRQQEQRPTDQTLVDQIRDFDSQLIHTLGVKLICDLMVEMKKTQYGLTLTSSEKADDLWYSKFNLASMPYPGCEFFVQYREQSQRAKELRYNWSLPLNDAVISVPSPLPESVGINFLEYQSWDIIQHTQNYLKLLLHYLQYEEGGILIHCVAGWDRTPLMISLLRLSLWADGLAHKSLGPVEILYLTLAYDWFIFGHKFEERLRKREEVLYFCFDFLQYIISDEYSLSPTTTPTLNGHAPITGANCFVTQSEDSINGLAEETLKERQDLVMPPLDTSNPLESSLRKVSLSTKDGRCLYQPSLLYGISSLSSPKSIFSSEETPIDQISLRSQQLLYIRGLFCKAYNSAIPPSSPLPSSETRGGGATGMLGGLWDRVIGYFPRT